MIDDLDIGLDISSSNLDKNLLEAFDDAFIKSREIIAYALRKSYVINNIERKVNTLKIIAASPLIHEEIAALLGKIADDLRLVA